jgi:hypothetical protein
MAEKRMNPLLIGGAALAIGCLSLVMCSEPQESYQPVEQMPGYDPAAKPQDGDTQTDTIKALQAYAREAVKKADTLNASTKENMGKGAGESAKSIKAGSGKSAGPGSTE